MLSTTRNSRTNKAVSQSRATEGEWHSRQFSRKLYDAVAQKPSTMLCPMFCGISAYGSWSSFFFLLKWMHRVVLYHVLSLIGNCRFLEVDVRPLCVFSMFPFSYFCLIILLFCTFFFWKILCCYKVLIHAFILSLQYWASGCSDEGWTASEVVDRQLNFEVRFLSVPFRVTTVQKCN